MKIKFPYLLSFFVVLLCLLPACDSKPAYTLNKPFIDKPAYGDILIDADTGEPANLNPVLASDASSFNIIGYVFNGLVKYDKDINIAPDLAEKWKVSPDGKVITFYLRKGVKWHDGAPFTSADVKFTYEKYVDPSVKTAYKSNYDLVSKVEAPDKYTFRAYYKTPYAPALESWGVPIIPAHFFSGKDFNTSPFNRSPIGTGPYKFRKWVTAQSVELTANRDYFEGAPYITGYISRIIPDQSSQFMNLQAGNLDMMNLSPDLYLKKGATPEFNEKFNKFAYPNFMFIYIGYNLANPLFKSKKTRQALSYAVDKEEIVKGVRQGLAKIVSGPFVPDSWAYNREVKPYPYDLDKAAALLKEDGWQKGKDGFLYRGALKFSFSIYVRQGETERVQIATIAQQQWQKLGITADIRPLPWNILISQFINKKKYEAVVMGWSLARDPDCYDIWHSSKTKEGELNFCGYSNPEVDKLLEQGRTVFDRDKRAAIYRKIHKIIAEDAPYTFLYAPYALPAVHKRIHGIVPAAAGIGYNFYQWYVPKEIQKYTAVME